MPPAETDAELIKRLNGETAKIEWHQLQKHYASGNLLLVKQGFDLIEVATAMHRDNTAQIKLWLDSHALCEVSDSQAQVWYDNNSILWAVVIPPFILVQETSSES